MKKKNIVIIIIVIVIGLILAFLYGKDIFFDKSSKFSNIESLQHSGAGDIK